MLGQTLGRYHIVEKIGAGGMGVVYLARDERLNRDVALKVLPPGTLADPAARQRFQKEAQTLSQLNHPNIATVYDFDTQGGADFLVMEYIPGVTLDAKIEPGGIPEDEVRRLGVQIAQGLSAAHEKGVVHRDLKPGNLRVMPDGRVKILDFGLAKLLQPLSDSDPTQSLTQVVTGTLPYMAPEQLLGEKVDARTDIYALGVVLYEMATEQRPLREQLSPRLVDAILHQQPAPPSTLNRSLSSALEQIILRCLEKKAANRYQTARDVERDLTLAQFSGFRPGTRLALPGRGVNRKALTVAAAACLVLLALAIAWSPLALRNRLFPGTEAPRISSVAVLPLENLSGDPNQEFLADGMTEALINDLGQIGALRVISRTSAMQYKKAKKPLPQIARELNVQAVVEGSVVRAGDRVRISAQLIETASDRQLWAESFERDLRDMLAMQSDLARAIANRIRVTLKPKEQEHMARAQSVAPDAYLAYQKGRFYWNQRNEVALKKAADYFLQALQTEPTYAAAYSGLADCYTALGYGSYLAPKETFPKAKAAAMKALELDPTLAEPHASLGYVRLYYDWDFPGAEREFQRAIALNANYATAHHWYSVYLTAMGRAAEARKEIERALELDPLSIPISTDIGFELYYSGQYDAAVKQLTSVLELDPNSPLAHLWLARTYQQQHKYPEAVAEYEKTAALREWVPVVAAVGNVYGFWGKKSDAQKVLQQLQEMSKLKYVTPYGVALVYAAMGEPERALTQLEKAYQDRSHWLVWIKIDPRWGDLRSDPRFQDLERRIGFVT